MKVKVLTPGNQQSKFYQPLWANLGPFFSYSDHFTARAHSNLPLHRFCIINDVQAFCAMKYDKYFREEFTRPPIATKKDTRDYFHNQVTNKLKNNLKTQ